MPDTPILDNHLHLDPVYGRNEEAVKDFARAGGTHMLVVNKPSWHLLDREVEGPGDFREVFELTIGAVEQATEILAGRAWAVLGVHPALISRLVGERGFTPGEACDLMQTGLDVAAEFVADDEALALKSGRPHYDVSDDVWEASNDVMKHAFSLGADHDCAVQLHTETSEDLTEVAEWAEERGLPRHKVVKHYSVGKLAGPTPSVLADRDRLEVALEQDEPFLMETDFIDDPDRPGAVLGPKTVPRRVNWLLESGHEDAVRVAHVETPKAVYDIDTADF
ncbi:MULTISPECIES: TatD family hydrolase [unclassified Haladaptatus]|uniref:TatD family hydrolase n=1 Tax=unclassified Haladaptatus TaxID=2622732 RepID=UPI0023E87DEF|nr:MULTISPECIES: TatD family hydrolase [unclassified Haladaptatus]